MSEYSICCTCGTKWLTGQDGSHSCTENLQSEIAELKEQFTGIFNLLGIGEKVRTIGVLRTCIENAVRRSDCLGRVESIMSYKELDEDGNECLESFLNWGESPDTYKNTFIKSLVKHDAEVIREILNSEPNITRHNVEYYLNNLDQ